MRKSTHTSVLFDNPFSQNLVCCMKHGKHILNSSETLSFTLLETEPVTLDLSTVDQSDVELSFSGLEKCSTYFGKARSRMKIVNILKLSRKFKSWNHADQWIPKQHSKVLTEQDYYRRKGLWDEWIPKEHAVFWLAQHIGHHALWHSQQNIDPQNDIHLVCQKKILGHLSFICLKAVFWGLQ